MYIDITPLKQPSLGCTHPSSPWYPSWPTLMPHPFQHARCRYSMWKGSLALWNEVACSHWRLYTLFRGLPPPFPPRCPALFLPLSPTFSPPNFIHACTHSQGTCEPICKGFQAGPAGRHMALCERAEHCNGSGFGHHIRHSAMIALLLRTWACTWVTTTQLCQTKRECSSSAGSCQS